MTKKKKVMDSERIDPGKQRAFENLLVEARLEDEDRAAEKFLKEQKRPVSKKI